MYNSETPNFGPTTINSSDDQSPTASSKLSMAAQTQGHQSPTIPGKSGNSRPIVSAKNVKKCSQTGDLLPTKPCGCFYSQILYRHN